MIFRALDFIVCQVFFQTVDNIASSVCVKSFSSKLVFIFDVIPRLQISSTVTLVKPEKRSAGD